MRNSEDGKIIGWNCKTVGSDLATLAKFGGVGNRTVVTTYGKDESGGVPTTGPNRPYVDGKIKVHTKTTIDREARNDKSPRHGCPWWASLCLLRLAR